MERDEGKANGRREAAAQVDCCVFVLCDENQSAEWVDIRKVTNRQRSSKNTRGISAPVGVKLLLLFFGLNSSSNRSY